MIEYIRRKSNSLIFKIFLWLVIFSFAIVGFTGAFSIVGNTAVSVDGKSYSVSSLYQDAAEFISQNDITLDSDEKLYELTLALANQKALEMSMISEVKKQGFTASDTTVKNSILREPTFHGPNGFDKALYERYLKAIRLTEPQLLDARRTQVAQGQYEASILYGIKASPYYQKILSAQLEKLTRLADVKYKLISPDDIQGDYSPTDEDVKAYYDKNLESFRIPEYRKIKVFEYSIADFEKTNPNENFVSSLNQLMDNLDDDLSAGFSVQQLQEKNGGKVSEYILDSEQKDINGQIIDIPSEMLASIFSDNMISPIIIGADDTGIANGLYSFEVEEVIASHIPEIEEVKQEITKQLQEEYKQEALIDFIQELSTQEGTFEEVTQNISSSLVVKTNIDQVNLASELNPFINSRLLDDLYLSEAGDKIIINIQNNWYIFEATAFKESNSERLALLLQERMNEIDEAYARSIYSALLQDIYKNHKVKIKAGNIRTTVIPSLRQLLNEE